MELMVRNHAFAGSRVHAFKGARVVVHDGCRVVYDICNSNKAKQGGIIEQAEGNFLLVPANKTIEAHDYSLVIAHTGSVIIHHKDWQDRKRVYTPIGSAD